MSYLHSNPELWDPLAGLKHQWAKNVSPIQSTFDQAKHGAPEKKKKKKTITKRENGEGRAERGGVARSGCVGLVHFSVLFDVFSVTRCTE